MGLNRVNLRLLVQKLRREWGYGEEELLPKVPAEHRFLLSLCLVKRH